MGKVMEVLAVVSAAHKIAQAVGVAVAVALANAALARRSAA